MQNLQSIYQKLKNKYILENLDIDDGLIKQQAWLIRDKMMFESMMFNNNSTNIGIGSSSAGGHKKEIIYEYEYVSIFETESPYSPSGYLAPSKFDEENRWVYLVNVNIGSTTNSPLYLVKNDIDTYQYNDFLTLSYVNSYNFQQPYYDNINNELYIMSNSGILIVSLEDILGNSTESLVPNFNLTPGNASMFSIHHVENDKIYISYSTNIDGNKFAIIDKNNGTILQETDSLFSGLVTNGLMGYFDPQSEKYYFVHRPGTSSNYTFQMFDYKNEEYNVYNDTNLSYYTGNIKSIVSDTVWEIFNLRNNKFHLDTIDVETGEILKTIESNFERTGFINYSLFEKDKVYVYGIIPSYGTTVELKVK